MAAYHKHSEDAPVKRKQRHLGLWLQLACVLLNQTWREGRLTVQDFGKGSALGASRKWLSHGVLQGRRIALGGMGQVVYGH